MDSQNDIEKLKEKLKEIPLTDDDISRIQLVITKQTYTKRSGYDDPFEYMSDLYKLRFKLELPTTDIANFFKVSRHGLWNKLKRYGWSYPKDYAMKRSAEKRDYRDIRAKGRSTTMKRSGFSGSSLTEEYVRQQLNIKLTQELDSSYEIIVGVNNLSILENGEECDIPIVIMSGEQIFKYVVEPGAVIWHKDPKRDQSKAKRINQRGYKVFIFPLESMSKIGSETLDNQINCVVGSIKKDMENLKMPSIIEVA